MRNGLARKSLGRLESRVSLLSEQGSSGRSFAIQDILPAPIPRIAFYNVYFDDECKITWI